MPRIKGECRACEGSGQSTSGYECWSCGGKGYLPAQTKEQKAAYVQSQGQTRSHHCHWPGCGKDVPPAVWGCKEHWFRLPKRLRDRIWATYRIGQEVSMSPSREYLDVATEVQEWVKENA